MRSCRDGFPSFLLVGFDDVGNLVEVKYRRIPNHEKETKIFPLSFIYFIFISRVCVRITDVDAKSNRSKDSAKMLEAHEGVKKKRSRFASSNGSVQQTKKKPPEQACC